jgi:hypothetical protein
MATHRSPGWVRLALCESAVAAVGVAVLLVLGGFLDADVLRAAAESSRF